MATSRRVGNYATSANAVIRSSDQIFDAAMSAKPDFTKISKEAIKGRSLERRAVTKAEGDVASAGLSAFTKALRTKNAIESEEKINDIKRPAKRMAGVVAGLGAISGAALMHKNAKEDKAERASFRAEQDAITAKTNAMFAETQRMQTEMMETLQSGLKDTSTTPPKTDGSEPTNSGSTPTPSPSPSPSGGSSLKLTPGKPITQAQGTQLLINQGMDPENARIGGAVMMAESSGKPGALNSNNEYSLGLWQHNRDTGEDRHSFYGIQDWSELSNPETNARATYKLWKRQGGWEPWGAYTNGSYRDFLK